MSGLSHRSVKSISIMDPAYDSLFNVPGVEQIREKYAVITRNSDTVSKITFPKMTPLEPGKPPPSTLIQSWADALSDATDTIADILPGAKHLLLEALNLNTVITPPAPLDQNLFDRRRASLRLALGGNHTRSAYDSILHFCDPSLAKSVLKTTFELRVQLGRPLKDMESEDLLDRTLLSDETHNNAAISLSHTYEGMTLYCSNIIGNIEGIDVNAKFSNSDLEVHWDSKDVTTVLIKRRVGWGGDVTGRTALARHFSVVEKLLQLENTEEWPLLCNDEAYGSLRDKCTYQNFPYGMSIF